MVHKRLTITVGTQFRQRFSRIQSGPTVWPVVLAALFCLCICERASAGVTGSISGIVTDESGAVIVAAEITARNAETRIQQSVHTDDKGFYSFQALPVGTYTVGVRKTGFKEFHETGIAINVNSAIRLDARLQVGGLNEEVTVSSSAVRVETTNTQMGEVIESAKMESLPLNGRSYTDLLALQPGVAPESSGEYGSSIISPSGNLNAGSLSVSGQRETANGFMVNGGNVNEGVARPPRLFPALTQLKNFGSSPITSIPSMEITAAASKRNHQIRYQCVSRRSLRVFACRRFRPLAMASAQSLAYPLSAPGPRPLLGHQPRLLFIATCRRSLLRPMPLRSTLLCRCRPTTRFLKPFPIAGTTIFPTIIARRISKCPT